MNEIHYKTTSENKNFIIKLAKKMGIPVTVCLAVIIFLDESLTISED